MDPVTYRIYRRSGPQDAWTRIASLDLAPGEKREQTDSAPLPTHQEYAVTALGECGESSICFLANVGERCSVASVDPAQRHR